MEDMNISTRVTSLNSMCLLKVIEELPHFLPELLCLPLNLKDKCINLMSKRGLLTDSNLNILLHNRLQVLDLSDSDDVTDSGLRHVAATCPQLRKLDLNATKGNRTSITDNGVCAIANGCVLLQVVYLRRCISLTDISVIALAQNCRQLRDLNLGGCTQMTDQSLKAIGESCRFLRSINISHSDITDQGCFDLANGNCRQTLKEVHLVGCRQVTDESVEALLQFCTHIQILLFHGCPLVTDQSRLALEEFAGKKAPMKQVMWTIY